MERERQRALTILMHKNEGMTADQIAQNLGVSLEAVLGDLGNAQGRL